MAEIVRSTRISLSEEARAVCIDSLNKNLANTIFAALAAKNAHWNVKGTGFLPTHRFYDELAAFYSNAADTIAERITALGGNAEGDLNDVMGASDLHYTASDFDDVGSHNKAMADLLGQIANGYRQGVETVRVESVNDQLTQDIYIELGREADKFLYFLEAELRTQ